MALITCKECNKHIVAAGIYCDGLVEKLAKYDHEWTDGMLETKFSHFRWLDEAKGVMTFIGDNKRQDLVPFSRMQGVVGAEG